MLIDWICFNCMQAYPNRFQANSVGKEHMKDLQLSNSNPPKLRAKKKLNFSLLI